MNISAKPVLVIGGGIAGMTAAVEAAAAGCHVVLVEREAFLGGRVLRMHRYFPKMCPPSCGFEINVRSVRQNPRITVHTLATVKQIQGSVGSFTARITKHPRYVTGRYPLDDAVVDKLSSERADDFNYGMTKTKALYLPNEMAFPPLQVLDREALSDGDAAILRDQAAGAVDLDATEEEIRVQVSAVIVATGWHPYDASKLDNLGFGRCDNVITNVMMERLASASGPTGGKIVRPSDGKEARNVAFVQCAGSRDDNHLPYCSAVCCMASLKQARYLRDGGGGGDGDSGERRTKATIFYIDIRAVGRHEKFYQDLLEDPGVSFVKGKVARIDEEPGSKDLLLDVEDTLLGENLHGQFDLVVLATGMVPASAGTGFPFDVTCDAYGFMDGSSQVEGVYSAGCAKHPCDVSRTTRDSTGAALKALQCLKRGE